MLIQVLHLHAPQAVVRISRLEVSALAVEVLRGKQCQPAGAVEGLRVNRDTRETRVRTAPTRLFASVMIKLATVTTSTTVFNQDGMLAFSALNQPQVSLALIRLRLFLASATHEVLMLMAWT